MLDRNTERDIGDEHKLDMDIDMDQDMYMSIILNKDLSTASDIGKEHGPRASFEMKKKVQGLYDLGVNYVKG
jgi:hypothetical protein